MATYFCLSFVTFMNWVVYIGMILVGNRLTMFFNSVKDERSAWQKWTDYFTTNPILWFLPL